MDNTLALLLSNPQNQNIQRAYAANLSNPTLQARSALQEILGTKKKGFWDDEEPTSSGDATTTSTMPSTSPTSPVAPTSGDSGGSNLLSDVLGLIGRPFQAIPAFVSSNVGNEVNAVKAGVGALTGNDLHPTFTNPFENAANALTQGKSYGFGDVLGLQGAGKDMANLVSNIALDPTTYLSGGASALAKGGDALKGADWLNKLGKGGEATADIKRASEAVLPGLADTGAFKGMQDGSKAIPGLNSVGDFPGFASGAQSDIGGNLFAKIMNPKDQLAESKATELEQKMATMSPDEVAKMTTDNAIKAEAVKPGGLYAKNQGVVDAASGKAGFMPETDGWKPMEQLDQMDKGMKYGLYDGNPQIQFQKAQMLNSTLKQYEKAAMPTWDKIAGATDISSLAKKLDEDISAVPFAAPGQQAAVKQGITNALGQLDTTAAKPSDLINARNYLYNLGSQTSDQTIKAFYNRAAAQVDDNLTKLMDAKGGINISPNDRASLLRATQGLNTGNIDQALSNVNSYDDLRKITQTSRYMIDKANQELPSANSASAFNNLPVPGVIKNMMGKVINGPANAIDAGINKAYNAGANFSQGAKVPNIFNNGSVISKIAGTGGKVANKIKGLPGGAYADASMLLKPASGSEGKDQTTEVLQNPQIRQGILDNLTKTKQLNLNLQNMLISSGMTESQAKTYADSKYPTLDTNAAKTVTTTLQSMNTLDTLEQKYNQTTGPKGFGVGGISELLAGTNIDQTAKEYNNLRDAIAGKFAKSLGGDAGALSNYDKESILAALPNFGDDEKTAKRKFNTFRELLSDAVTNSIKTASLTK